jgi:glutamate N-acetyltransferase/amino-acid N-acetyltransferase
MICRGFQFAGVAAGIKKTDRKDLGLIFSSAPAAAAGLFTCNRVQAAPVLLDRERIQRGSCRAVIVNSGNANCCTGGQGRQAALRMARCAAVGLQISEEEVLVASTGVIGEPLPVDRIEAAAPALVQALRSEGMSDFAEAIMTTDTVPKIVSHQGEASGKRFSLTAIAKGAGMIQPDMATMLCFVVSDILASGEELKSMLLAAADRSLNRITIDGDTSTNDTTLLMANGLSGVTVKRAADRDAVQAVLNDVLLEMARRLVKDGEGATKLVEIVVSGARSNEEALRVADTVANSSLVKTAFFGQDANWGRILAAAGRAGVELNPDTIDLRFDRVLMVKDGMGCGKAAEAEATEILRKPEFTIALDLNQGSGSASMLTCDFSVDYVKINADYRS